jgi:hypothetical protein
MSVSLRSPTCDPGDPLSIQGAEDSKLEFYLNYHRRKVTAYHYHLPFDPSRLCTQVLLEVAVGSKLLQYAMAALSAHIYWGITEYRNVEKINVFLDEKDQFLYYGCAVSSLRKYLENEVKPAIEIVASTALVLATFEVCLELFLAEHSVLLSISLLAFNIWKRPTIF